MKYLIIILCFFMASCSTTEKNLKKAIEKHGARESAAYISLHYPEYLEPRTVRLKTTIGIPVKIPESTFTSKYLPGKNPCKFEYGNHEIRFKITPEGEFSYTILAKDTIVLHDIDTVLLAAPCPTQEIVNEVKGQLDKKDIEIAKLQSKSAFQQIRDIWFYISLALVLGYGYLRFKP